MNDLNRKKIKARVNRIAGQVGGVGKMIDEDRYCIDILDQISALRSALDALGVELLANHIEHCIVGHGETASGEHPSASAQTPEELLDEVRRALHRFLK